jgi:hypothetical protein
MVSENRSFLNATKEILESIETMAFYSFRKKKTVMCLAPPAEIDKVIGQKYNCHVS